MKPLRLSQEFCQDRMGASTRHALALFRVWTTDKAADLLFCSLACGFNALDGPEEEDYTSHRFPVRGSVGYVESIALRALECYGCGLKLHELAEEHNAKLSAKRPG